MVFFKSRHKGLHTKDITYSFPISIMRDAQSKEGYGPIYSSSNYNLAKRTEQEIQKIPPAPSQKKKKCLATFCMDRHPQCPKNTLVTSHNNWASWACRGSTWNEPFSSEKIISTTTLSCYWMLFFFDTSMAYFIGFASQE